MVTRRILAEDSPPSASTAGDPTGSPHVVTPLSTTFVFEEQPRSNRVSPTPSSTTSGTPQFTPSSTPFVIDGERASASSFSFRCDLDPDTPLPSVERDFSPTSSHQTTPNTTVFTSSTSAHTESTEHVSDEDAILKQIGHMSTLRLTSPQTPGGSSSAQRTRTPSIHVTPSAPRDGLSPSRAIRADSLVGGITALHIDSLRADSLGGTELRESRSPSPSRRRRLSHQIECEDQPDALSHMREMQSALANVRTLTARMADVLSSSGLHIENGSSIQSLHQQATRLNNFQLPSSRIVGLVGDSGVGKSSLINSLLDKMELTRSSGSGTACTCAVTEYHFHDRDDFTIHVDYFALNELKKQFEELLRAYRDFQSLRIDAGTEEDDDDDEDAHARRRLQRKATLAEETFRASFGEKLDQMPTVLSSIPFEHAVDRMVEWASQVLPQQGGQETFSTISECSSRLRELGSESDNPLVGGMSRASWPFIQKIRVYLKAYILSKGLIIADLPGLRDLNSARKAITERYVRQCDQILVVAKIDRAITDESIKEIFELAKSIKISEIDIICTRSEDINSREAKHDWPAERVAIEEMEEAIDNATQEVNLLKDNIDEYEQDLTELTREQEQQLMKLQQDCRRAEKSRENHEFEFLRRIVELRNDKVSKRLREGYRNHVMAATLKTFCVSNKLYWDNREKPATASMAYLNLSGIIELRRYCIGIVAQSRLRATKEFITNEIPAFLGSVELWVEAGLGNASAESKQQTLDAVAAIQHKMDELTSPTSQLNTVTRALYEEFSSRIYSRMAQGRSGPRWTVDGRRASLAWEHWHHMSYKAFCSNFGDHSTAKVGHRCWNQEVIEGMKDDLSAVWVNFAGDLEVRLDQTNTSVDRAFGNVLEAAMSTVSNRSQATSDTRSAMRTVADILRHRKDLTFYGIEQAITSFHSELSSLQTDTLSSIRTAFIGGLMEDTYHAANMEYGSGSDRRRKNIITGKFSSPALFQGHRQAAKDGFRDIACKLQEKMKEIVTEQVNVIEADLHMLRDENEVLESERDPKFGMRVRAEMEWAKTEADRIGRRIRDVS